MIYNICLLLLFTNVVNGHLCSCYCPHYAGIIYHYACSTVMCTQACMVSGLDKCQSSLTVTGYCGMGLSIVPYKTVIFTSVLTITFLNLIKYI